MSSFEKVAINAILGRIRQQRQVSTRADVRSAALKRPRSAGSPGLREVTLADFQAVSHLKQRHGIVADALENWERLWYRNPALTRMRFRPKIGWVLEANGEIVGYLGNICLPYWYGDTPLFAASASGLVVEPSYRIFTIQLIEVFFRQTGFNLYIATSAIESVTRIARSFGSEPLPQRGSDTVHFWILREHAFARAMARKMQLSKPVSRLGEMLVSLALTTDGVLRGRRPRGFSKGLLLREKSIDEISEELEALWLQKLREQNRLFAERSYPLLRWHFDAPGFRGTVRVVCCYRAGELVGYAIVRTNFSYENGLQRSILADILAKRDDPEVLRALLVGSCDHAERIGAGILEVGCVPLQVQQLCIDSKAYVRTLPACPFNYKANDPELHRALNSSTAWYASAYDGDTTLMPEISAIERVDNQSYDFSMAGVVPPSKTGQSA